MICKNCGNEMRDGVKFCMVCGSPVEAEAPVVPETQPMDPVVLMESEFTPDEGMVYEAVPNFGTPVQPKKGGKGAKIAAIILSVVLVLVLAAAGAGGYFFYQEYTEVKSDKESLELDKARLEEEKEQLTQDYFNADKENANLKAELDSTKAVLEEVQELSDSMAIEYGEIVDDYNSKIGEYNFYRQFAVFVSEKDKYYHTYDCADWDRNAFWLFNVDYAISQDYTACPNCH